MDDADVWLPLALNVNQQLSRQGSAVRVNVIARLKPGVTLESAKADLSVILDQQRQAFPQIYNRVIRNLISGFTAATCRMRQRASLSTSAPRHPLAGRRVAVKTSEAISTAVAKWPLQFNMRAVPSNYPPSF